VNGRSTILKGKLAALFLLVVFLFIYVVKVFHHHEHTGTAQLFNKEAQQIVKSNHCSICDYHLAKDSPGEIPILDLTLPQQQSFYFDFYQSRTTSSIGLNFSDRGPPALA
jgi:hypothetical protein